MSWFSCSFSNVKAFRFVLALLAFWAMFFAFVHASLVSLNQISIPVLGLPLGFYLAAQGALIAFIALLFLLSRAQDGTARDRGADAPG